jgi:hypothetical protein
MASEEEYKSFKEAVKQMKEFNSLIQPAFVPYFQALKEDPDYDKFVWYYIVSVSEELRNPS